MGRVARYSASLLVAAIHGWRLPTFIGFGFVGLPRHLAAHPLTSTFVPATYMCLRPERIKRMIETLSVLIKFCVRLRTAI
jgi:hypothetical protein